MRRTPLLHLWFSTGVLLIAGAAIFSHADDLSMWFDELWSMFTTTRSLEQVVRERDLVWPPGYALTLHFWIRLISAHDLVVHVLGALLGLLGVAFAIQAGRALDSDRAGWLAGIAFGTSSYALTFLLEARGYGMLFMVSLATVCFHARWVRRPTWRRAVPYALAQILLLYTQFSGLLILALTAIRVLFCVPRRLWTRWASIMAVTGLAFLPILPQSVRTYRVRADALSQGSLPSYLLGKPEILYRAYSAHQDALWLAILILAAGGLGLLVWRGTTAQRATVLWLLAWGVGAPLAAYVTRTESGLFSTRYISFTLPGGLLLIGLGLAHLPRRGWVLGGTLLLVLATFPWQPFDHRPRYSDSPPVRDLIRELTRRFETGDRLVIDPSIGYGDYAWWYYEPLYFTGGRIPQAADGVEAGPRVWYLERQGSGSPDLKATVERGRIPVEFWGPWYFIVTLYEGPPLDPGYRVGDALRFRGTTIPTGSLYFPGDTVEVQTWWSVDERPSLDYSIGLHLVDSTGRSVLQVDSGPAGPYTPAQTSAWEPGGLYRDDRQLKLPWCFAPGDYQVRLVVYQWWDGVRLVPEASAWRGPEDSLLLGEITADSFAYCE